ncbi:MAG: endopeptidase La [Gammaproteobacteria bacterium]|nr:MAG: endopeptidase La [Gammaproteobacteria bacterium]
MKYNLIPLRDVVVFPGVVMPLFVGRPPSVAAVDSALSGDMKIVLVTQKQADVEQPKESDLHGVATLADIIQVMKLPDGSLKLIVEGRQRVSIDLFPDNTLTQCDVTPIDDKIDYRANEAAAAKKMLLSAFGRYLDNHNRHPKELLRSISETESLSLVTDTIISHTKLDLGKKIQLLSEANVRERITHLLVYLEQESELVGLEQSIRQRVKAQMDKNQREYYLNEQAKAIQKELEEIDESNSDFGLLEKSIKKAKMPADVEKKCLSELEKLKKMPAMSSEATVLRNYIETMLDYPWSVSTETVEDLAEAKAALEASHYGLEDVKTRILEYLAVQQRTQKASGSILCLVGPPGVGKTSIGKSIADAVNRRYIRMALGGVRDEAEIRGHRRTYIGAMPGKIVQNITKAKVNNPLFLLDEIDKMGMDHRGDPASAMLEVLDAEQNHTFNDHYMEVDMDLSQVMFVATANHLDIPGPLLDRMEIIRIPGYTESEKIAIAKQYLVPRNIKRHGLSNKEIKITDNALKLVVENYTREAGVRQLDREIGKLCRKVVTGITLKEKKAVSISKNNLSKYLGVAKYTRDNLAEKDSIGRINGLAWTSVGGELLNIEVVILPGKGKTSLTGKLGDVMKESVQAAMTVVKSHVNELGVSHTFFQEHDFHIHLPEAATPKDGPSAGTAIATALLSAVMSEAISHKIAMTGEITLQGNVLPIGGLKEKLFAAAREGIKTVFIPKANEKDLSEIADEIKENMVIFPVKRIEQIFSKVFSNKLNKKDKKLKSGFLATKYMQEFQPSSQQH